MCKGIGSLMVCDADKLITFPDKPIIAGAMNGTKTGRFYGDPFGQYVSILQAVSKKYGFDFSASYKDLDDKALNIVMKGCGDEIFDAEWEYKRGTHEGVHKHRTKWQGFLHLVEEEYVRKHDDARGEALLELMKNTGCDNCHGYRLKPEMLKYIVKGLNIGQLTALIDDDAIEWFSVDFTETFERELEKQAFISMRDSILERLVAMQKAGLGYISTDRIVGTLSGGEFQRLQLARLVRAPLTGVAYILDEPSFGLHHKDILQISDLIQDLNQHGNTIVMVDHSPLLIKKSQYTIELGPGAGKNGGQIVFSGKTVDYSILENNRPPIPQIQGISGEGIFIKKAHANNLRDIDVVIPSGVMTAITGVSGSGKTSLLDRVIFESFRSKRPVFCLDFKGIENFSNLIYIAQTIQGIGYNATVGSKLGISGIIAEIFAASAESEKRGFKSSHFTTGSRDGRCSACEGKGFSQVSMDFYNDVVTPCERCSGTGFCDDVLEVIIEGKTISEALQITFDEIIAFFDSNFRVKSEKTSKKTLELIQKTGLSHLSCDRSLKTLSGGELQRLRLVYGLSAKTETNNLILLDEPTGGLHPKDIQNLLKLFNSLIEEGNTLVCVTHEPLLMAVSSKIIELGPGGGAKGGQIV